MDYKWKQTQTELPSRPEGLNAKQYLCSTILSNYKILIWTKKGEWIDSSTHTKVPSEFVKQWSFLPPY